MLVRCLRDLVADRDTRQAARDEAFETLRPIAWEAEQVRARKAKREPSRAKADARARRDGDMSVLVVEPLRFAIALEPEWIALEQVPACLPLWRVMAQLLEPLGYSTWCGVLEAERYGVPQTRERAVLMARRGAAVHPPEPTHHRFVPNSPRPERVDGLFGTLEPWVSMAEALGWGMTERPYFALATAGGRRGGADEQVGGSGARRSLYAERERGAWTRLRATGNTKGGTRPDGLVREADEPAPTITSRADQLHPESYDSRGQRDGRTGELNRRRSVDEPAPTIAAESRNDSWRLLTGSEARPNATERTAGEPAPTLAFGNDAASVKWVTERPATSVNGDPRIAAPGRHDPEVNGSQYGEGTVRVTVEEAAALQTFPAGYPWQGTQTAQFMQVGNAVPPLLAEAVLRAVVA